jgi:hypothetical protein
VILLEFIMSTNGENKVPRPMQKSYVYAMLFCLITESDIYRDSHVLIINFLDRMKSELV